MSEPTTNTVEAKVEALTDTVANLAAIVQGMATPAGNVESDEEHTDMRSEQRQALADRIEANAERELKKCANVQQINQYLRLMGAKSKASLAVADYATAIRKGLNPRLFSEERKLGTPYGAADAGLFDIDI